MRPRRRRPSVEELLPDIRERRPRALAQAVTLLEDGGEPARRLVGRLHPDTGRARIVGVTGPPGAGKSTLVDRLAAACRERGETVGILAVDPTSPYSGGALLGDRIRMQSLATDPGVFIRSMATRGALGGLARATHDAVDLLDAAGFDWVLIETVGVGQDEVDVVKSADSVAVVTVPGLGDGVQAIKAGLMEIADLFVINKADRDGVEAVRRDFEQMLALAEPAAQGEAAPPETPWRPPILEAVASRGEGTGAVLAALEEHRAWLTASGRLGRRRLGHLRLRVETILRDRVLAAAVRAGLDREVERGLAKHRDPYTVAERLFDTLVENAREEIREETP
jgi:LAO/AO transport system kinase